jgi:hypothetical protein
MLEPMAIENLDIWSDIVEKVHNLEIVRRNQERILVLTGQDAARRGSTATSTPPGEYNPQRCNLLL